MKRLAGLLILMLLAGGAAAGVLYVRVNQPYRGYGSAEQFVEIPQGAGSRVIGERLVAGGVVRDETTFRTALWLSGKGRHLQAGEYRFDRAMTPFDVIDKLARGDVFVITVTFREGLTIAEMAKIVESHGLASAAGSEKAAGDASAIRELDPHASNLEGYLVPETYALPRHTDAERLVSLMVGRFQHVWSPEIRAAAEARHLSAREAVTLASIVEKETG